MRRLTSHAAWMRSRARNTLRRPLAIAVAGTLLSTVVLILLLMLPGRATRASTNVVAQIPDRPDSMPAATIREQALQQIATADSILQLARTQITAPEPQIVDTFPPHLVARRQELNAAISSLTTLINRANSVPLPASYRNLGESPVMAGVPGVRLLLDSLAGIERERESFGTVMGADPLYIALTARAGAVGRSIVGAAEQRRAQLRAEVAPLLPPRPPPRPVVVFDTLRTLTQRDEARAYLLGADEELARIRERHAAIDQLERRARELRNVGAPLSATVSAAIVIGMAVAFAFILFGEMRRPRVADVRDAERTGGARVMAIIEPRVLVAERDRRSADVALPDNLDPFADHYRRIYLHLSTRDEPIGSVTVTGDDPDVAAVVALNIAAYDVREARSALVVDTDPLAAAVSRALEIPTEPGLSDVLSGTAEWTEAIQYITIGRDQVLAVMPSGRRSGQPSPEKAERVRSDLRRLSSRHDLMVFAASVEQARPEPTTVVLSSDVIVCATLGRTHISTLRSVTDTLRTAGMTIHGLILWGAEPPRLPREKSPAPRPERLTPAGAGA